MNGPENTSEDAGNTPEGTPGNAPENGTTTDPHGEPPHGPAGPAAPSSPR